eukprot:13451035-Ditylum_brightwellii.AAC.1
MDVEWMPTDSPSPVHVVSINRAQTQDIKFYGLIHHIAQLLSCPTTTFLIASDGSSSEDDDVMTFGWKIILEGTTLLVHHTGPAFGHAISFRAEGYNFLSVPDFYTMFKLALISLSHVRSMSILTTRALFHVLAIKSNADMTIHSTLENQTGMLSPNLQNINKHIIQT